MSKFLIIFIFIYNISFVINEDSIIIEAQYFPNSNKIIYQGKEYIISQESNEPKNINNVRLLQEKERSIPFSGEFWFNLATFILLACFAGTMSGLTVGYLSIDTLILEVKMTNGTESEKYYAEKIYKLVANHHWLLVTLLLCNSFACEAMPIVLDKLVNEMMAIILSVTVLLFVGEIIPQALCTGPNQMKIASKLAPFTYVLMIITYPLSYPIAKFMDYVIGVHGKNRFCNSDLKSIIDIHAKELIGNLSPQQLGYFTGFLDIMNKKVGELILPLSKTLKLDYQTKLNKITVKRLISSGYSRIPVYENHPSNLIGILRMKHLVGKDLSKSYTLRQLKIDLSNPIHANEDTFFLDLFDKMKEGKSHMAFIHEKGQNIFHSVIYAPSGKKIDYNIPNTPIKGIITLEDLIEFWLKIPILDEEDYQDIDKNKHPRRRKTVRRKTLFEVFGGERLHGDLNKLFDRKSIKPHANIQADMNINNNDEVDDNYSKIQDNDDDEYNKLIK
jgi:CBS domain containing-hemolysin-like protein